MRRGGLFVGTPQGQKLVAAQPGRMGNLGRQGMTFRLCRGYHLHLDRCIGAAAGLQG